MEKAYYAITNVEPYRTGQVVVLDEQDGWARSGYLRELVNPSPGPRRNGYEMLIRVVSPPEA